MCEQVYEKQVKQSKETNRTEQRTKIEKMRKQFVLASCDFVLKLKVRFDRKQTENKESFERKMSMVFFQKRKRKILTKKTQKRPRPQKIQSDLTSCLLSLATLE